jgi:hypothetical protein
MADDNIKRIPTNQLRQEDGAHELATSPDMKPYLNFAKAVIQNHDPAPEQLAIVLKALVGAEEMQRMMIEAIGVAKKQE